jgi:xanthine dehydrogenase YagR molybdenum-binding subunit
MRKASTQTTNVVVNDKEVVLEVHPLASAVEVIREDLGLTGTKLVCGAGVCGACTILVDGRPTASCVMPACGLDGTEVQTVEHFSPQNQDRSEASSCPQDLHPVQKAFLAHDGLQCGYCTPGFIVESIAFYQRWRSARGISSPSRKAIALALSGHLCRCGAYVGIYEAVRAACAGEFDDITEFSYPRHEGLEKVTGRARYTTDVRYDGMLVAKLLGSAHAHALVKSLDWSAAEAMPGVEAIVDVLNDPHRVVRYVGHPILAIAAIDEHTAHEAIKAVKVEYEPRPFVIDPIEALSPDSSIVFPERKKSPPNASEGPIPPGKWEGNLRTPSLNHALSHKKGKADKALKRARAHQDDLRLVENTYSTPGQTHTALEPHACVAVWEEGRLTVHASTQTVFALAKEIARHYHLRSADVVVHSDFVGGAFGAKQGMRLEHTAAIDLARLAKAPVKLVYDRLEEMLLGGYRPSTRIETSVVTDSEANQRGITALAYGNSGIAVQSQNASWIRFAYSGPKHCDDYDVLTNVSPAKPFRGPSGPSAFWALEQSVDQTAHELAMDPVSLRRSWEGSDVRNGLYDWVESIPEWKNRGRPGSDKGRFRAGIGLAIGSWFSAYNNVTRIQLDATPEGLVASCALQDMGQGSRSVIAKAIADELGVPFHSIRVNIGTSTFVEGPASSGSRTTPSIYPTSVEAAHRMRDMLVERAKSKLGLSRPSWEAGGIRHATGHLPISEALQRLAPFSVTSKKRGGNSPFDLLGALPSGELGMTFFLKMTGALSLVAVEVDTRLGLIKPQKIWMGMAVGKIVNPELANSQVYGGVIQSLGFALTEERQYDPRTGTLLTFGLEDYRIPGIGDIPEIEIFYDESGFEKMRGGAVGLSEVSTLPTPAALGNAVFNATGWRPTELPLRPHRVLENVSRPRSPSCVYKS